MVIITLLISIALAVNAIAAVQTCDISSLPPNNQTSLQKNPCSTAGNKVTVLPTNITMIKDITIPTSTSDKDPEKHTSPSPTTTKHNATGKDLADSVTDTTTKKVTTTMKSTTTVFDLSTIVATFLTTVTSVTLATSTAVVTATTQAPTTMPTTTYEMYYTTSVTTLRSHVFGV